MTEETTPEFEPISDEEAQRRIQNMMDALDRIYNLHAPNQSEEVWTCDACNGVQWPCATEAIILESLGL